jgi:hypothetical protein
MQWCTLRDRERLAGPADDVAEGDPDVGEAHLAVAERLVVHAHGVEHPLDPHAGGVARDQHHRVPVVPVGVGVGEAHEHEDPAVGVAHAGRPPLAAVDDHLVAVDDGGGLHGGGVGRRDPRLGHRERGADPAVEQRLEPLLLLRVGAVAQQHLHVAGVGRVAVEHQRRDRGAAGELRDRRVVDVGQPLTAVGAEPGGVLAGVLVRQEEVPQAPLSGLGLELLDQRQRLPRVAGTTSLREVAVVVALHRGDLSVDEVLDAGGEVGRARRRGEVHGRHSNGTMRA